jgi:hypothetical protein
MVEHATSAPAGKKCTQCLCCSAVICFGCEALCAACDDGTHPPPPESHRAAAIELPAPILESIKFEPMKKEKPVSLASGRKKGAKPIDPEIKRAVLAQPVSVSNAALARKYTVSDVTVGKWRREAGIAVLHGRPLGVRGPHPQAAKPRSPEDLPGNLASTRWPPLSPPPLPDPAVPEPPATAPESAPVTLSVQRALLDAWWKQLTTCDKAAIFGAHCVIRLEGFVS